MFTCCFMKKNACFRAWRAVCFMNRYVGAAHEMRRVFSDGVSTELVMVLHFAFPAIVATREARVSRCCHMPLICWRIRCKT